MVMVMESVFFLSNKLTKPVECGENRPVEQVHGGTHTHTRGQRLILLPPACRSAPVHSPTGAHPKTERDELQKILQTHSVSGIFFYLPECIFLLTGSHFTFSKKKKKHSMCLQSKDPNLRESSAAIPRDRNPGVLPEYQHRPLGIHDLRLLPSDHTTPQPPANPLGRLNRSEDITGRTQQHAHAPQLCSSGGSD